MIVDHADRLHEGVDDGRPAEFEAALRQFLGDRARDCGLRRHLASRFVVVDFRPAVDEVPQQLRKARPLVHDVEPGARRAHRAFDLCAVAHDAGILHQPLDLGRPVARDFFRNEIVEGAAEIVALAQDGDPRQAGLETVEHEFFVERAVVVFRHAPFLVVIGDVERIVLGPRTAHEAVGVYGSFHWARFHPAALVSPGKAKRAQSGLTRWIGTPPLTSGSPRASPRPRGRAATAQPRGRPRRSPWCRPGGRRRSPRRRPRALRRHSAPAPRGCAPCRDAPCARPPPGRHSSLW